MALSTKHDLAEIARQFRVPGEFVVATPFGSGHINDTYCALFNDKGATPRFIIQRINHHVFKNPAAVMENIVRVTSHIREKLADRVDVNRRVLTVVPARDGRPFYLDHNGNYWRAYLFIANGVTHDSVESPRQAFEAAKMFGEFQKLLADLPAPRLHDTIPDFHHTPKRFATLEQAIQNDVLNRAKMARAEIEFVLAKKGIASVLFDARLPERVTHNDTKVNNVMLDATSGEGLCVMDLDTVMPGLALYDFGDLVRSATCPTAEDERDLSKVTMQFPMFAALARGYCSTADFLTPSERQLLAFSGKLITFEVGIRFLTDYLLGDTYFKTHRPGHNLDRCRTQFKLVESIERQEDKMNQLLASL